MMTSNLRKQIKKSGLTMPQVAEMMGIDYELVRIQCKKGIQTVKTAARYAEVLHVPLCKVLGFGNVCNCGK